MTRTSSKSQDPSQRAVSVSVEQCENPVMRRPAPGYIVNERHTKVRWRVVSSRRDAGDAGGVQEVLNHKDMRGERDEGTADDG